MSTVHLIRIPSGNRITVGAYAKAWKHLKRLDPTTQIPSWDHFDTDAGDILREMRTAMMARINAKDPRYPQGRKAGEDYATAMLRLRPWMENPRLAMHQVDRVLGARVRNALAPRLARAAWAVALVLLCMGTASAQITRDTVTGNWYGKPLAEHDSTTTYTYTFQWGPEHGTVTLPVYKGRKGGYYVWLRNAKERTYLPK